MLGSGCNVAMPRPRKLAPSVNLNRRALQPEQAPWSSWDVGLECVVEGEDLK